jgi:hypothetical protein
LLFHSGYGRMREVRRTRGSHEEVGKSASLNAAFGLLLGRRTKDEESSSRSQFWGMNRVIWRKLLSPVLSCLRFGWIRDDQGLKVDNFGKKYPHTTQHCTKQVRASTEQCSPSANAAQQSRIGTGGRAAWLGVVPGSF